MLKRKIEERGGKVEAEKIGGIIEEQITEEQKQIEKKEVENRQTLKRLLSS